MLGTAVLIDILSIGSNKKGFHLSTHSFKQNRGYMACSTIGTIQDDFHISKRRFFRQGMLQKREVFFPRVIRTLFLTEIRLALERSRREV